MYQRISLFLTGAYLCSPIAALASSHKKQLCEGVNSASGATGGCQGSGDLFGGSGFFNNIANMLIFIVGAVSVLMIIIGGLRYVLSAGDPSSTKSAKDTVLYAVVGVIVALLAFAIVNFVIAKIG